MASNPQNCILYILLLLYVLYIPSSVKNIGLMCCIAELLLETGTELEVTIVTVMEDSCKICLWYDSFVGFIHFYFPISVRSNHRQYCSFSLSTFFFLIFLVFWWTA